jgi:type IV pilus assembly protein PilB
MQIPGVNQMQINAKAGVTFASGLRSILRQDPNVILVGEIRDQETADIALGAAQTGICSSARSHQRRAARPSRGCSTSASAVPDRRVAARHRAQRLVRRPCPGARFASSRRRHAREVGGARGCRPTDSGLPARLRAVRAVRSQGRIAIHEVLAVTDEVRDLISSRAAEHVDQEGRERAGMRTLLEDGIDKAAQGLTTLDEVLRVVSARMRAIAATAAGSVERRPAPAARPASAAPRAARGGCSSSKTARRSSRW